MNDDEVNTRLHQLADLVHAVARHLPAPADLEPGPCTPVEIGVMRYVAKHPGTSAREAADACRLPSSNFSRVLKTLVIKGLLERRPDGRDARIVRLHPTRLAVKNTVRMRKAWSDALRGAALDREALLALTGALGRIEAHLVSDRSAASAAVEQRPPPHDKDEGSANAE